MRSESEYVIALGPVAVGLRTSEQRVVDYLAEFYELRAAETSSVDRALVWESTARVGDPAGMALSGVVESGWTMIFNDHLLLDHDAGELVATSSPTLIRVKAGTWSKMAEQLGTPWDAEVEAAFLVDLAIVLSRELRLHREFDDGPLRRERLALIEPQLVELCSELYPLPDGGR